MFGKIDMREADGVKYFTPRQCEASDADVAEWLARNGRKNDAASVATAKGDLEDGLRNLYIDRVMGAVIEPDARTREIFLQGTKPGTVGGELLRFIAQFKSFPTAVLRQTWGREIYGRGYNGLTDMMLRGKGEALGMMQFMVWSTIFGYMSMVAKDVTKGKTPRDIFEDKYNEDADKVFPVNIPVVNDKTVLAAFLQGGGIGIYGDFLFGDMMSNRFGKGMVNTMAGPVIGAADDIMDIWGRAKRGDDLAASSLRFAIGNTPFINMFYTKAALDYMFVYNLQEQLNPGYLRRMERRIEKENGQTFMFKPSEYAR